MNAKLVNQVGDPVGYNPGFSRSRTRKHEQGTFSVGYGLGLVRVKFFERIFRHGLLNRFFWLGREDSNPHYRDQNPVSCR